MDYEKLLQSSERNSIGEVITPNSLIKEMLDKLPQEFFESKTATFLDPCSGSGGFLKAIGLRLKAYGHSNDNISSRLYGFEISTRLFNRTSHETKRMFGCINMNKQDFLKTDINMKFDAIVLNPPYKKRFHLDFLEKGYDLLKNDGKMVIVHPTNWMIHLRENSNFKTDSILKEKIGNHFVSFDFYNAEDLFPGGGCSTYYPLTITSIDKSKKSVALEFNRFDTVKKSIKVNNPLDVNHIGSFDFIKSIENKINAKSQSFIKNAIDNTKSNKYYVSLNWMSGNGFFESKFSDGITRTFKNRYNFINNSNSMVSNVPLRSKPQGGKAVGNYKAGIPFNNEANANSFLYYVTSTLFVKYLIIAYNMDQHVDSVYKYVPMIDFNLMDSDTSIFKFFQFSKEEISLIKNTVENYKHD